MATVLETGDLVAVQIGCYATNQASINTVHYRCRDVVGGFLLDTMAELLDDLFADPYKDVMGGVASYYGVRCQRIAPGPRSVAAERHENIGVGTAGATILPTQVTGIISLQTAFAGSGYRGRLFIPFPAEADNADATGLPTVGYQDRLDLLADTLFTDIDLVSGVTSMSITAVIKHAADDTYNDVEGWVSRGTWGTQRRRGSNGQANRYPPF